MADGGVLLVGSIPLSSAEKVFRRTAAALSGRLQSIPNGETGVRENFISWQIDRFPKETIRKFIGGVDLPAGHSGLFTQESILPTLYDNAALKSYAAFTRAREQGIIPNSLRFQVSLPTPFNPVHGHTMPKFHCRM